MSLYHTTLSNVIKKKLTSIEKHTGKDVHYEPLDVTLNQFALAELIAQKLPELDLQPEPIQRYLTAISRGFLLLMCHIKQ